MSSTSMVLVPVPITTRIELYSGAMYGFGADSVALEVVIWSLGKRIGAGVIYSHSLAARGRPSPLSQY